MEFQATETLRRKWQDLKTELTRRWNFQPRNEVPRTQKDEADEALFEKRETKTVVEERAPHRRPL